MAEVKRGRKRKHSTSGEKSSSSGIITTTTMGVITPTLSRKKGVTLQRTLVYGNIAEWLGPKADELHTHKWTAYVRGPNNEDISYYVKQVVFNLHPSFANPVRVLENHPFEITEIGWGEFELAIRVHFVDPNEKPVDLYHGLILYPPEGSGPLSMKKPVVKEAREEVKFKDPSEHFYALLKANESESGPVLIPSTSSSPLSSSSSSKNNNSVSMGPTSSPITSTKAVVVQPTLTRLTPQQIIKEKEDLELINSARDLVREEIKRMRNTYNEQKDNSKKIKEEIQSLKKQIENYILTQQESSLSLPSTPSSQLQSQQEQQPE